MYNRYRHPYDCYDYDDCDYDGYYDHGHYLLAAEGPKPSPPPKPSEIIKKSAVLKSIDNTQPIFTQSQIDDITAYVNNYRSIHQAPPLKWDTTIAQFSQNWANYLLINNVFQHSGSSLYGENLAYFKGYGTDLMTLLKLAIDMWYNEIKDYDFKKPGFAEGTGHFTALVWKSSTNFAMGFAINPLTTSVDVTMNMSPPGNVSGQYEINVLEATSPIVVPPTTPVPTPVTPNTPQSLPRPPSPPQKNCPPCPAQSSSIMLKANIINSLYNIIGELNKNKSKDIIIHDINNIIIDIVNI